MSDPTSVGRKERERRQISKWRRQDRVEMGWSEVGLRDRFWYIGFERDEREEDGNGREEEMSKKREKRGSKGELTDMWMEMGDVILVWFEA